MTNPSRLRIEQNSFKRAPGAASGALWKDFALPV